MPLPFEIRANDNASKLIIPADGIETNSVSPPQVDPKGFYLKKIQEEFGRREQTLASEESALVKQRDAAAADLDKKLTDLQIKLKDNIDNYLGKIAKERDYDYILSKGLGQSVLFGRESFDITKEAVATMNEDYAKTKSGK